MNIFQRIKSWFTGEAVAEPQSQGDIQQPEKPQQKEGRPSEIISYEVSKDIRKTVTKNDFINELRAIEPPSKAYQKAYNDLVEELKKIRPPRTNHK